MENEMLYELISVLVPVYNAEDFLDECVQSIVDQTYTQLEIILWNDGSTDNSQKICEKWAQKDKRIRCICTQNQGVAYARNGLIENARGKYICFVDSDDYVHKDYIKVLYNNLIDNDADMSGCCLKQFQSGHLEKISQHQRLFSNSKYNFVGNADDFLRFLYEDVVNFVGAVCKLVKAEIMKEIVYTVGVIHEDGFTCRKIAMQCKNISWTNEILYFYRRNEEGITNKLAPNRIEEDLKWIKDDVEFYESDKNLYLKVYAQKAYCHFLLGWWNRIDIELKKVLRNTYKNYMISIVRSKCVRFKVKLKYLFFYFKILLT